MCYENAPDSNSSLERFDVFARQMKLINFDRRDTAKSRTRFPDNYRFTLYSDDNTEQRKANNAKSDQLVNVAKHFRPWKILKVLCCYRLVLQNGLAKFFFFF